MLKQGFKRIVASVASAAMVFALLPVAPAVAATSSGAEYEDQGFKYVIDSDGTAAVVGIEDTSTTTISVPSSLGGITVSRVSPFAFVNSVAQTLSLPDSLAFVSEVDAKRTDLLSGFVMPRLQMIEVSDSCSAFKSVDGVLYTRDGRVLVSYPGNKQQAAFSIPEGTETVALNCFSSGLGANGLSKITIPTTLSTIYGSFWNVPSIEVAEGSPFFSSDERALFNADRTELVGYLVSNTSTTYAIPETVESIRDFAIYKSPYLEEITIPAATTSIGRCNFPLNQNLKRIVVDSDNRNFMIQDGALVDTKANNIIAYPMNASRDQFVIPSSITSLGDSAFNSCAIKTITVPASVSKIGAMALYSIYTETIYVSTQKQYDQLTGQDGHLYANRNTRVVLTETVTGVVSCDVPEELEVGETVSAVSTYGEARFTVLTTASAKKSASASLRAAAAPRTIGTVRVDYYPVGKDGIVHLKSLQTNYGVYLVTEVKKSAFKNRKDVKYAKFENAQSISPSAFQSCRNLGKVDLGSSLTSIGSKAFMGCKSLKSVKVSSKKLKAGKVGASAFKGTAKKAAFQVPKSKLKAYKTIFQKAGASKKASFKKA